MLHKCRNVVAVGLLHRKHISVFFPATSHPNSFVFSDSQAFDDQSNTNIRTGKSKQLHQVSKASDFYVGRRCDLIFHLSAAVQSFNALDNFCAKGDNRRIYVVGKR